MSGRPTAAATLAEYYRCPAEFAALGVQEPLSAERGYFRFGETTVYGRAVHGRPAPHVSSALEDVAGAVSERDGHSLLPFDLAEVTTNLRQERYRQNGYSWLQKTTSQDRAQRFYYRLRPLMGVQIRKHLQRVRLSGWDRIAFPRWPVDTSVDCLMEGALALLLKHRPWSSIPFIWFWPDGASSCVMLTHDVEGQTGLDFCGRLMDIDDSFGIKAAFQLIPEGREDAWQQTAATLRARGFEVNLHDLNHDGQLFANKQQFLTRASRINDYAREFKCDGFRSAVMYREQSWFEAFDFAYDMSVPNVAHLEPQRGGCCTVMPYFVGNLLELPLTTVQDYSLFHILNDYSTALWKEQIRAIAARSGLISIITHPDYLVGQRERAVYVELLRHLSEQRQAGAWITLPGEINRWWRNRQRMALVRSGDGWRVEGPDSLRARVAYASLEGDHVVYRFAAKAHEPATADRGSETVREVVSRVR